MYLPSPSVDTKVHYQCIFPESMLAAVLVPAISRDAITTSCMIMHRNQARKTSQLSQHSYPQQLPKNPSYLACSKRRDGRETRRFSLLDLPLRQLQVLLQPPRFCFSLQPTYASKHATLLYSQQHLHSAWREFMSELIRCHFCH